MLQWNVADIVVNLAAHSRTPVTGLGPGTLRRCVGLAIPTCHRPFVGTRLIGLSSEMTGRAADKQSHQPRRVSVEQYDLVEPIQIPGRFANAHQSLLRDIVELLERIGLATWRDPW